MRLFVESVRYGSQWGVGAEMLQKATPDDGLAGNMIRWSLAGVVATAALIGLLVLVTIVVVVLQPPGWLQLVLGAVLAFGAAALAWLIAAALGSDSEESRPLP